MIEKFCRSGLIEAHELKAFLDDSTSLKLIDASYALPGAHDNPKNRYAAGRIGKAVFFDIDEIADQKSNLPHMLPDPEEFGAMVSHLGIGNDDFVVIYDQTGMAMAACRVWWTFRVFGHDRIAVLNGGLPSWQKAGYPLNRDPPPQPSAGNFSISEFRGHMVADRDTVFEAQAKRDIRICDMRPAARFSGDSPDPRPGLRAGHIPGSGNLPWPAFFDPESGRLKADEALRAAITAAGINPEEPVIASCGSGVTACTLAFSLYHLGHDFCRVYDGSWAEWGQDVSGNPVSTGFS